MEFKVDHLGKKYGNKAALSDVSYTFNNGVYGLLGPNGAGKTTFLDMIATTTRASTGRILYRDMDVEKQLEAWYSRIGYLPQHMEFYPHFTGYEFLKYLYLLKGGQEKYPEQLDLLLTRLHLYDVRNDRIRTYSGGMKQRLGIAQSFIGSPELLLLDEPTVGLDLEERAEFKQMIREMGKDACVLLSTHIVSDVEETADQVLFMSEGRIIKSLPLSVCEEEMTREGMESLEDYYLKLAGRKLHDRTDTV